MEARKQHVWALWAGAVTLALLVSPMISQAEKVRLNQERAFDYLLRMSDPVKGKESGGLLGSVIYCDGDLRIVEQWQFSGSSSNRARVVVNWAVQAMRQGRKLNPVEVQGTFDALPPSTASEGDWNEGIFLVTRYAGTTSERFVYARGSLPSSIQALIDQAEL